jgi:protein SCO1/2
MLSRPGIESGQGQVSGQAAVGGPFTMVDQDGRAVDQRILNGKWSAVFFGYTYCPDVCPATLQTLAAAARKLGPKARELQVVFVSVDPQRDTPAQLKSYLSNQAFPRQAVGLTGTPAQVAAIAKAYRVYFARSGTGQDYTVDHSAAIYLMNPQGRFDTVLTETMGPDQMAQQIVKAES